MTQIAVMQGRLVPPEGGRFQSFPKARWRDEFALAAAAGLNAIEWIYDAFGENVNPLASDDGTDEIRRLSKLSGIEICSLCADYFMDYPFLRTSQLERTRLIRKMEWLLSRCALIGIRRVVIPFVDQSRIENEQEYQEVLAIVGELTPFAKEKEIELHLETALPPEEFARLLDQCDDAWIRVNYDSGNSASLGYCVDEEFAAYGHRIGSVHIKDRVLGGGTVPLGTGNADLASVFKRLAGLGYRGDFVLQIARAIPGDELNWITQNRSWLANQIQTPAVSTR
jgi:L-ribulose-5-phosphate 3-epimerase